MQPSIPSSWNRAHHALSIFGTDDTFKINTTNMAQSLSRIINYIQSNPADKKKLAVNFVQVTKSFQSLIIAIYSSRWDLLPIENSKNFCELVSKRIVNSYLNGLLKQSEMKKPSLSMPATAMNSNTPVASLSGKVTGPNEKKAPKPMIMKKSYVEAFKANILSNIEDIIQVKKAFPALLADEVGKILKAKNSGVGTKKPKINMMIRKLSRREDIIPITKVNTELIINLAYTHISDVNNCLKISKSDTITDFICINVNGIIIMTNKPASNLDLSTIEKYLKNIQNVNLDSIKSPCLPKSKSYMKIVKLSYSSKLGVMTPDIIKGVLKELHLFKNAILASKSCIIKASPKSDKAVVWVDIWDSQSSSCVKNIINWRFNIGQFIVTIRRTNMNPGISQYKSC